MNKNRRETLGRLAALIDALPGADYDVAVGHVLLTWIEDYIRREDIVIKKMSPHQDKPGTAANYHLAVTGAAALRATAAALRQEDLQRARDLLVELSGSDNPWPAEVSR